MEKVDIKQQRVKGIDKAQQRGKSSHSAASEKVVIVEHHEKGRRSAEA